MKNKPIMYQIDTMERPYHKTPFRKNQFLLNEKTFQEFLNAVTISKDIDPETGEIIDIYSLTFNSGIRHTACRVCTISVDNEIIYNYGEGDAYICTKTFQKRLDDIHNKKGVAA